MFECIFKGRKREGRELLNQLKDPRRVINVEGFTLLHTTYCGLSWMVRCSYKTCN